MSTCQFANIIKVQKNVNIPSENLVSGIEDCTGEELDESGNKRMIDDFVENRRMHT